MEPDGETREKRPTLPVVLFGFAEMPRPQPIATVRTIVDSGADYTTFSAAWAKTLGINIKGECKPERVSTMGPASSDEEYTHFSFNDGLSVEVLGTRIVLPKVLFATGISTSVLGRRDFFVDYLIAFDERNERFFIERLPDRPRDDEDDDDERDMVLVAG